jgi:hypothetical protein
MERSQDSNLGKLPKKTDSLPSDKIIEKPSTPTKDTVVRQKEYDYVVSEAAVGQVGGTVFTLAGIYPSTENGYTVYSVMIKINKIKVVEAFEGTILELNEQTKLKVVKIQYEEEPKKGNVYFKRL